MEYCRKYHPSLLICMLGVLTIFGHLASEKNRIGKKGKLIKKEVMTEQSWMYARVLAASIFV